jgi:hypothetical protein
MQLVTFYPFISSAMAMMKLFVEMEEQEIKGSWITELCFDRFFPPWWPQLEQ